MAIGASRESGRDGESGERVSSFFFVSMLVVKIHGIFFPHIIIFFVQLICTIKILIW